MDYEGSGTDSAASLNYSMQSYANDIVAALQVLPALACMFLQSAPASHEKPADACKQLNLWNMCNYTSCARHPNTCAIGGAGRVHGEGHPSALHCQRERPGAGLPPRRHGLRRPQQAGLPHTRLHELIVG